MLFKPLKDIGKENNWYRTNSIIEGVFGLYKGYFFQIEEGIGYKLITTRIREPIEDEETQANIIKAFEKNEQTLKFNNAGADINNLWLKFHEHFRSTKKEVLYKSLDFFVDVLKENKVPPQDKCYNCEQEKNLGYYLVSEQGVILCERCYDNTHQEMNY